MSTKKLLISSKNHASSFMAVFENVLKKSTLVDCILSAEGQYLKAHKLILSAASDYFELLFTVVQEKDPVVILTDVNFNELKAAVNFMYTGEVEVCEDRLSEFLKVAKFLQIKGLHCYKSVTNENNVTCGSANVLSKSGPMSLNGCLTSSKEKLSDAPSESDVEGLTGNEHLEHHDLSWDDGSQSLPAADTLFMPSHKDKLPMSDLRFLESREENSVVKSAYADEFSAFEIMDIKIEEPDEELGGKMKFENDNIVSRMEDENVLENVNVRDTSDYSFHQHFTIPGRDEVAGDVPSVEKDQFKDNVWVSSETEDAGGVSGIRKDLGEVKERRTKKLSKSKKNATEKWNTQCVDAHTPPVRTKSRPPLQDPTRKPAPFCVKCELDQTALEGVRAELQQEKEKSSLLQCILHSLTSLEGKVDSLLKSRVGTICEQDNNGNAACAMRSTSLCYGLEVVGDSVNLGQGIMCSKVCWEVMNTTLTIPNWCIALLRGHFGEDAMYYRCKPRHEGNKKFSSEFLVIAASHFGSSYINRRIEELNAKLLLPCDPETEATVRKEIGFLLSRRQELLEQLPAQLSDRCFTMWKRFNKKTTEQVTPRTNIPPLAKRTPRKLLSIPKFSAISKDKSGINEEVYWDGAITDDIRNDVSSSAGPSQSAESHIENVWIEASEIQEGVLGKNLHT